MDTFWDEEQGEWRAPTEKEIRSWVAGREALERAVDSYLDTRKGIDPKFYRCWTIGGGADVEFTDSSVILTWIQRDRYGDQEAKRMEFPIEHLWAPDTEAAIRADMAAREELERQAKLAQERRDQEKREAAERKAKEDTERNERATLARLMEKYGVEKP